nr:FUSC family protein [Angustibacter aerolatus]
MTGPTSRSTGRLTERLRALTRPPSLRTRVTRLRRLLPHVLQCAVAAGVAWVLARTVLDHPQPFFAPVAAIVGLGLGYGQRLRRVAEITVGVAVGVFLGDVSVQARRVRTVADRPGRGGRHDDRRAARRRAAHDHAGRRAVGDHPGAGTSQRVVRPRALGGRRVRRRHRARGRGARARHAAAPPAGGRRSGARRALGLVDRRRPRGPRGRRRAWRTAPWRGPGRATRSSPPSATPRPTR